MGDESSNDSDDEWGTEELPDLPIPTNDNQEDEELNENADNEDDWLAPAPVAAELGKHTTESSPNGAVIVSMLM